MVVVTNAKIVLTVSTHLSPANRCQQPIFTSRKQWNTITYLTYKDRNHFMERRTKLWALGSYRPCMWRWCDLIWRLNLTTYCAAAHQALSVAGTCSINISWPRGTIKIILGSVLQVSCCRNWSTPLQIYHKRFLKQGNSHGIVLFILPQNEISHPGVNKKS